MTLGVMDGRAAVRADGSLRHQNLGQAITRGSLVGQHAGSRMQSDLKGKDWILLPLHNAGSFPLFPVALHYASES